MPAGVYVDFLSITTFSARVVWTVGPEIDRGSPIFGYDIEVESQYYPGVWNMVAPGNFLRINAAEIGNMVLKMQFICQKNVSILIL